MKRKVLQQQQQVEKQYVTLLYDFLAQDDTDLTVSEGQVLLFIRYGGEKEKGWSVCRNLQSNEDGYVPTAYHTTPYFKINSEQDQSMDDDELVRESKNLTKVAKQMVKRRELVKETIKTEETYVGNLNTFTNVYAKAAKSVLSDNDYQMLFGNIGQIMAANNYLFNSLKKEVQIVGEGNEELVRVGKIFQQTAPFFRIYTDFVNNYDKAFSTFNRLSKQKTFKNYLQECKSKLGNIWKSGLACDLPALLINPIQRIPRYQMLLQAISEATDPSFEDYDAVKLALQQICQVAKHCNQSKAVSDALRTYYRISNLLGRQLKYPNFVKPYRRFVCELEVGPCITTKGAVARESIALMPNVNWNLYLFTDTIILERSVPPADASDDDSIQIIFLQFCKVIHEDVSSAIILERISNGLRSNICIRAKDDSPDHALSFRLLKESLDECIANSQQNVSSRFSQNPYQLAEKRINSNQDRKTLEVELQMYQVNHLELRKKLHKTGEDIALKEIEMNKLKQELDELYATRDHFNTLAKSINDQVNSLETGLSSQVAELSKVDELLLGSVNQEVDSFKLVFNSKPNITNVSKSVAEKDIYKGRKVRRRKSLINNRYANFHNCDYTGFADSPLMQQLHQSHGEAVVVFSSLVQQITATTSRLCRFVISNNFILLYSGFNGKIEHSIPASSVVSCSVSSLDDNFLCIHCVENDYLFSSVKKTEILEILQWVAQPKYTENKALTIHVSNSILFQPEKAMVNSIKFETTTENCDFRIERGLDDVWKVFYNPDCEDTSFLSNKVLLRRETPVTKSVAIVDQADTTDIYQGMKLRQRVTKRRTFYGDYLSYLRISELKRLGIELGDVCFCDQVVRYDERLKASSLVLILTSKCIYFTDPHFKSIKASIQVSEITRATVSSLIDNYLCLHSSSGTDELFCSDKKTELIETLNEMITLKIDITDHMTFRKRDQAYSGTFHESNENNFAIVGQSTFKVSVTKKVRAAAVFEKLAITIDGMLKSIILTANSPTVPSVKLPANSKRTFTALLTYYAVDNMSGYHVEQRLSSANSVLTSIEDCPQSDMRYTIELREGQIIPLKFRKVRRIVTRVLDNMGTEVAVFALDVQL